MQPYWHGNDPKPVRLDFRVCLGQDVDPFCDALVKSTGVLLLPGTLYADNGNHFRIGFGRKNLPEAVARL